MVKLAILSNDNLDYADCDISRIGAENQMVFIATNGTNRVVALDPTDYTLEGDSEKNLSCDSRYEVWFSAGTDLNREQYIVLATYDNTNNIARFMRLYKGKPQVKLNDYNELIANLGFIPTFVKVQMPTAGYEAIGNRRYYASNTNITTLDQGLKCLGVSTRSYNDEQGNRQYYVHFSIMSYDQTYRVFQFNDPVVGISWYDDSKSNDILRKVNYNTTSVANLQGMMANLEEEVSQINGDIANRFVSR